VSVWAVRCRSEISIAFDGFFLLLDRSPPRQVGFWRCGDAQRSTQLLSGRSRFQAMDATAGMLLLCCHAAVFTYSVVFLRRVSEASVEGGQDRQGKARDGSVHHAKSLLPRVVLSVAIFLCALARSLRTSRDTFPWHEWRRQMVQVPVHRFTSSHSGDEWNHTRHRYRHLRSQSARHFNSPRTPHPTCKLSMSIPNCTPSLYTPSPFPRTHRRSK